MIVRLPLEAEAKEFAPGRWWAILTCSSDRFRDRPVWVGRSTYLSEEVALAGARRMLTWLERQSWMGE